MEETRFYKKLDSAKVQCRVCANFCLLSEGERGKCGIRENIKGDLYSLVYGKAAALNIDPIEKKPLYHFLPGSHCLSLGTVGCPFACKNCQNWQMSQGPKNEERIAGEDISPKKIVKIAKEHNVPVISYTYTEPTGFLEYALDTMELAKEEGISNCFVSQGYMSFESAKASASLLDAINIDIKSFDEHFYIDNCGGRLKPVLETAKVMKKKGVWVEITTLVIPTLSDSDSMFRDIASFIYKELGPETPWHISRFSGEISWKLKHLPETPKDTLMRAYEIGKEEGLRYVYVGNLLDSSLSNTYCPQCGATCLERAGFRVYHHHIEGKCSECGEDLHLILG
ncbi:MAG: AmmeMemoRadiSam system radical SAM enzyme [Patescibacteria group bacterium]